MIEAIIDRLRAEPERYFSDPRVPEIVVTGDLRSHPNSSVVVLAARWPGRDVTLYVKMQYPESVDGRANRSDRAFKVGQVETEYEILRDLEASFRGRDDLGVIRTIACFPEHLAIVTAGEPGPKLLALLRHARFQSAASDFEELSEVVRRCGLWLREFQALRPTPKGQQFEAREVPDYCDVRLEILSAHDRRRFNPRFCSRIREAVARAVAALGAEGAGAVPRHNDFGPHNIIVNGGKVVVLDFAGFGYGPRQADYVNFWMVLEELGHSILVPRGRSSRLKDAFLIGFGNSFPSRDPGCLLFRTAHILDKMGDIHLDWAAFPWHRRAAYYQLYRRSFRWLEQQVAAGVDTREGLAARPSTP